MTDNSTSPISILDGYVTEQQFADSARISARTVARYRGQKDGLPFLEFGGRIYIPVEGARDWLKSKVKKPNTSRKVA